jgi:hypothetical protein
MRTSNRFRRFQLPVALCVVLAMCLFTSTVSAQNYYEGPFSWMNPLNWGRGYGTAANQTTVTPAYVPGSPYYSPTAYSQGAPSLSATGGTCQTQTTCYPPSTQATVQYRWSYSPVERTRMVDVPVYDSTTGGLRVEQKAVTSYSLLPWLHLKPYAVAAPAATRQTASYSPSCNPCFTCGSTYGSANCSSCTPGATVISPSGGAGELPRTLLDETSNRTTIHSNTAQPVRTQRTIEPAKPESAPHQESPSVGPILVIPPRPSVASRGIPVYTAAMSRPPLGAPQPPSMLETYTAARVPSPAPIEERTYTAEDRQEMWQRISAAKAAARAASE